MDYYTDYAQDKELAIQFFREFTFIDEEGETHQKYQGLLTDLANRDLMHMSIELADIEQFNQDLCRRIHINMHRYIQIFYEALDEVLPSYKTKDIELKEPMDVFIEQRSMIADRNQRLQHNSQPASSVPMESNRMVEIEGRYPPELNRVAEISFKPINFQAIPIRQVQAEHVGHFVTIRGIVTRCFDTKPQIQVATYTCDQCGCETFQQIRELEFTPLFECSSSVCKANKVLGKITMQSRGSKFVNYQEIKLQEHTDQVPEGHIPRTITVVAHGQMTDKCAPGDHISVSGIFLLYDKSSYRVRMGGLPADTYVEVHHIARMNKTEDDELDADPLSLEEAQQLISGEDNFLKKLSSSIAPEIYGHEQLKKALLLLLVGGVDKSPDGMKIRGNINICIVGDPGVAKSQLLSFIDRLASRSQYTTGRGSSGVGLTAAVLKDPLTNELILEGGALVLADQGVCCIDEFDKMMDADRTAIHEVMEQQTVSIAKAGILATLNARVSILAAANPTYGRYNFNKDITYNLDLPPALLSRFDLLWLIIDEPEEESDRSLAHHVTEIHKNPASYPLRSEHDAVDMKTMRKYISLCKKKNPVIPESLSSRFEQIYLDIRSRARAAASSEDDDTLFTSPRSLLAIIRLSTAFARLRLADQVDEADIVAAVDLYNYSRQSVERKSPRSATIERKILKLIKDMIAENDDESKTIHLSNLLASNILDHDTIMKGLDRLIEFELVGFDEETQEITLDSF